MPRKYSMGKLMVGFVQIETTGNCAKPHSWSILLPGLESYLLSFVAMSVSGLSLVVLLQVAKFTTKLEGISCTGLLEKRKKEKNRNLTFLWYSIEILWDIVSLRESQLQGLIMAYCHIQKELTTSCDTSSQTCELRKSSQHFCTSTGGSRQTGR